MGASEGPVDEAGPSLLVRVYGEPAPQGSKSYAGHRNGKPILVESSKKVAPWRLAVRLATLSALNRARLPRPWAVDEPVEVEVTFYLPKPPTVARSLPTVPPDLDKLARSTLDALTDSGAIADDALVTDLIVRKRYESAWEKRGAAIRLSLPEHTSLWLGGVSPSL